MTEPRSDDAFTAGRWLWGTAEVLGEKSHRVSCNGEKKGMINSDSGPFPMGSDSGRALKDEKLTALQRAIASFAASDKAEGSRSSRLLGMQLIDSMRGLGQRGQSC